MKGDFAPLVVVVVVVLLGMIVVVVSIGARSAKHHLFHSPTVEASKKRRESVTEVDDPDLVVGDAEKFINKSFLCKMAHIQDQPRTLPDPVPTTTSVPERSSH